VEGFLAKRGKGKPLPFFCVLFFALPFLGAVENDSLSLPLIARLDSRDTAFKQYLSDVESARRRLFLSQTPPEAMAESLTVYAYIPLEGDDILGLAARCNIPYAALATLNRLSHPEDLSPGEPLLLPSSPGLFIPERPGNDLERLLNSSQREEGVWLSVGAGNIKTRFRFLPGEDLSPTERAFFLNKGFHYPLENFQVSSRYGPRVNPVTGRYGVHQGLDLAAPEGAEVYAARDGVVSDQGEDPVFGRYIIISHGDNWVSLYGHLSKIETTLNQELRSGNLIGKVGSTGQSTGPHLHFELRQNGRARDPGRLLGIFRQG
jgi:murein DD-endopeptidase MepM/ murein hydrolase activator NlpD